MLQTQAKYLVFNQTIKVLRLYKPIRKEEKSMDGEDRNMM